MRFLSHAILVALVCAWAFAAAAAPRVIATISPIHSLTAAVMAGVGTPKLLLPPGVSPHTYTLRPSDARALAQADVVVWIGKSLEAFLAKPLATLAAKAKKVELSEAPGLITFGTRTTGIWVDQDEDGAGDHQEEAEAKSFSHRHHGGTDPHIWIDPQNAQMMVQAIAAALIQADPGNAETYEINAETLRTKLAALDRDVAKKLQSVKTRPFVVFHDSYQYLERRYHLNALGTITSNPDTQPGAKHVAELRARLAGSNGVCLFKEPQFSPSMAQMLAHETRARLATLDPLGSDIEPGPNAYFIMMTRLSDGLHDCLAALP